VESAILQLTYLRTAAVFGDWIVADWVFALYTMIERDGISRLGFAKPFQDQ
jgi:hypothetical protein